MSLGSSSHGSSGTNGARRWVRGLVPVLVGLVLAMLPAPTGLSTNAWHYFALFTSVIVAVMSHARIVSPGTREVSYAVGAFST